MADSTTHMPQMTSSQASKEVTFNEVTDALSPAALFGRNADTTTALTWGYLGGDYRKADGTLIEIANGTVTLTASATNYIKETDGVVSVTTAAPGSWPGPLASNAKALYAIICDADGVNPAAWPTGGYKDYRTTGIGSGAGTGSGTVTSVAASVPAFLSVSGSPVTTSGTLAITYSGTALPIANGGTGGTSASAARTALGLGTVATLASDTDVTLAANSDSVIATQKATKAYVDSQFAGAGTGDVVGPASAVNNRVVFFDGTTGKLIKDSGLTLSGTNTGDQTSVTGNAGTATALQTARTIDGQSFDGSANITVIAPGTHAATGKTTPVDADELPLVDSAASNVLKKLTWANLKATLKTYFDTLYAPLSQPLVAAFVYPGAPTASAFVGAFAAPAGITTLTFAAAIAGSSGKALTAATAQTDFDVRKNATTSSGGSSVGTVRFAASGTVPTFIAASGFTLTGGTDYLTVWAPATPDTTLANVAFSLYCTRS